nr:lamin tail domain-containing protein [Bacillus sp. FJAT-50079]
MNQSDQQRNWLKKFNNPNIPLWDFYKIHGLQLAPKLGFEQKLATFSQDFNKSIKVDNAPTILITEVVPDTDNYGNYNAFEYIEIYNNSNEAINLKGYSIWSGNWRKKITDSIFIQPWNTQLFWTRRAEIQHLTLEAFNNHYFASYHDKYLSVEKVYGLDNIGGLRNSGYQTVTINDPQGAEVVKAGYSDVDVSLNHSIVYSYPIDGSLMMEKISGHQKPSPGWVKNNQVPPRPILKKSPPSILENVHAVPGNGKIKLTWSPNNETDIYRYHIYKNGIWEFSVPPEKHTFILSTLAGNVEYTLEVAAEDISGNLSEKSAPLTVKPSHQLITQEERSFIEKDPAYHKLWDISKDGPIIPGLAQDLIPQGMTYYEPKDWLLIVNYLENDRPSTITIVDATTEELVKSVLLYNKDGSPFTGHAGGITISKNHVWVSSENSLYSFTISDLISAPNNGEIYFQYHIPVPVDASYTFYDENILWVGEFYEENANPTDPSHHLKTRTGKTHYAWMIGFDLHSNSDMLTDKQWNKASELPAIPDYIFSTTDKVQGAIVQKEGVILSTSYGTDNDSALYRYNNPLKEKPYDYITIANKAVPTWFLDGAQSKPQGSVEAIPMPEGIANVQSKYLYVVFESGANKYRYTATSPMDHMLIIDKKQLLKEDKVGLKRKRK